MTNEAERNMLPEEQDVVSSVKGALEAMHMRIEIEGGRIRLDGSGVTALGLMSIMTDLLKAITEMAKKNLDEAEAHAVVGSGIFVYLEEEFQLEPWKMFTDQKPDCFKALDENEDFWKTHDPLRRRPAA